MAIGHRVLTVNIIYYLQSLCKKKHCILPVKLISTRLWTHKTMITRAFALYRGRHMSVYLDWHTRWKVSPKPVLWQIGFKKIGFVKDTCDLIKTSSLEKYRRWFNTSVFVPCKRILFIAYRSLTAMPYMYLHWWRVCLVFIHDNTISGQYFS